MLLRRLVLTLCALLVFTATGPFTADAAVLTVDVPQSVPTGTAFVVTVVADAPEPIELTWQTLSVSVTPAAAEGGYVGRALLPVAINAAVGTAQLSCTQGTEALTRDIPITANTFKTQELTVEGKYVNPPKDVQARIERDRAHNRAALATRSADAQWSLPFVRPVAGSVSSSFGLRRVFNKEPRAPHMGLDLRGASGTPIHALAAGTVLLAEEQYYSGNVVFVDHGMGVISSYLHMSEIKAVEGQRVARGEVLGLVGATGRVTGPHLHLGLSVLGTAVDPLPLLESAVK